MLFVGTYQIQTLYISAKFAPFYADVCIKNICKVTEHILQGGIKI